MEADGSVTIKFEDPEEIMVVYPFKEFRFWRSNAKGVEIHYEESIMILPWHTIKYVHVQVNSPEYVRWATKNDIGSRNARDSSR